MKFPGSILVVLCLLVCFSPSGFLLNSLLAATNKAQEAELEASLKQAELEKEILQSQLDTTKQQTKSIEGEINRLASEIKTSNNIIAEKNSNINQLSTEIGDRELKIKLLNEKTEAAKESVAKVMVSMNELDDLSFVEIILSSQNLSEALIDRDIFSTINKSMSSIVAEIRSLEEQNRTERIALQDQQSAELDAKKVIELEKQRIQQNESKQRTLLTDSKQQEATYSLYVAGKEQEIQRIRTALFALRDTDGIEFWQALEYAEQVQKATGVRPAFLLAIIQQESNLGQNVGQCLVTDLETGNGKGKNTGTFFERVMNVNWGDPKHFERITKALGRDWKTTPVSCPIGGQYYYQGRGFGGAMGPAQFIPSTWALYETRIASAVGIKVADPWRAMDAFMASGLYLADLGAGNGTYSSEIAAACNYYGSGGSSCAYGTQVMARVNNIQVNMIDVLKGK